MTYINVEVNLDEFSDDEIREEYLKRHGDALDLNTVGVDADLVRELLTRLYEQRRLGQDYESVLDQLIYEALGRIV